MASLAVVVLLALLALFNYRCARSILYPPFIFCSMWLLAMSLYQLNLVDLGTLHNNTLQIIAFGAICFSFGGQLAWLLPNALLKLRLTFLHAPERTKNWRYIMVCFIVLGVSLQARSTFATAASGVGGNVLARARSAALDAADDASSSGFNVAAYFIPWAVYSALLFYSERPDALARVTICLGFIGAVFTTGRTWILSLMAGVTCLYLMRTKKQSFLSASRIVLWPAFGFLLLWTSLTFVNKDTAVFGKTPSELALFALVGYTVGPTLGLDYVIQNLRNYGDAPHHTFKLFLSLATALHVGAYKAPPVYDAFAPMDFPTNVYTVYKFFLTDFGFLGMFAFVLLLGFAHSLLYRKANAGSELARFIFALSIFPALMSIFDDHYSAFGSYIHATIFGAIYIRLRSYPLGPASRNDRLRIRLLPRDLPVKFGWY